DDEFEREPDPQPAPEPEPQQVRPTDPNPGRGETGSFHAAGWTDERTEAATRHPSVTAPGRDDLRTVPARGDSRDHRFRCTAGAHGVGGGGGPRRRPAPRFPRGRAPPPEPPLVWAPPPTPSPPPVSPPRYAQGDPWSAREDWSGAPRHAARKGRGGAIVAAMV